MWADFENLGIWCVALGPGPVAALSTQSKNFRARFSELSKDVIAKIFDSKIFSRLRWTGVGVLYYGRTQRACVLERS